MLDMKYSYLDLNNAFKNHFSCYAFDHAHHGLMMPNLEYSVGQVETFTAAANY